MSKSYVLLSGGIDSSTALAIAKYTYGSVTAVSLNYGQRHQKEIAFAKQVCKWFNARHLILDIENVMAVGGLTDPNLVIPQKSYQELGDGVSPTYVPFRNGIMIAILAGHASIDPDAVAIYHGAHAEDGENDAYPDCTPEFMGGMINAVNVGTYRQLKLITPLLYMTKADVVTRGTELDVPYHLTWSCYEGGKLHCGTCPTCLARKEAFIIADVTDPTKYAIPGEPN